MTDYQDYLQNQRALWKMNKLDVAAALVRGEVQHLRRAAGVAEVAASCQRAGAVYNLMQIRTLDLQESARRLAEKARFLQQDADALHAQMRPEPIFSSRPPYHYR